ncbi:MAG TPA: hypothetical protein VGO88_03575 [Mycetocola sp.]|uniref:hypothetical protein n=1 Tax=Mycetocola sp. TaxID=1871042 RepID=UPI0026288171|nr:hypothetical protein [Mycetocola sp.]MCU1560639.1 hypothetical protein [Mycetocola sp.]HEV7848391.1 hypothetical protein [Mycetocola sp.]
MKRIEVLYGGGKYTIPNRDIADVQKEITDALMSGSPHWLEANSGEGILEPAYLLIASGITVAVVDVMATVTSD